MSAFKPLTRLLGTLIILWSAAASAVQPLEITSVHVDYDASLIIINGMNFDNGNDLEVNLSDFDDIISVEPSPTQIIAYFAAGTLPPGNYLLTITTGGGSVRFDEMAITVGMDGPEGPKGEQGDPGSDGADGATGLKGDPGSDGADGKQGIQGLQGDTGPQGEPGVQGAKGDSGDVGPMGATGPKGDQGPAGTPGIQGDQGVQGIQGPKGLTGDTGPQGDTGTDGADGVQGPQGLTGDIGPQGAIGDTGPQGVPGPPGDFGPQGPEGPQGPPGSSAGRYFLRAFGLFGPLESGGFYMMCDLGDSVISGGYRITTSNTSVGEFRPTLDFVDSEWREMWLTVAHNDSSAFDAPVSIDVGCLDTNPNSPERAFVETIPCRLNSSGHYFCNE